MKIVAKAGRLLSEWIWILDYAVPAVIVLALYAIHAVYDSGALRGTVNYFELGKDVACVSDCLNGKVLCRDVFHYHGPLNTVLQIFCMSIFGPTIAVVRGFFFVGTVLTMLLAYLLARRLCESRGFAYAAAPVLIVETYTLYWATRWGGLRFGMGLFALLCAIQYLKNEKKPWAACAGICAALAFMLSCDVGIICSAAIAGTFCLRALYGYLTNGRSGSGGLLFFVIGVCVAFAPFALYGAFTGALAPYLETIAVLATNHLGVWIQHEHNAYFSVLLHPGRFFTTMDFKYALPAVFYIFSGAYLLRSMMRKSASWREFGMVCLTIYGALMYAASFRSITGPQFQMALQPLIILGAVCSEKVFSRMVALSPWRARVGNSVFPFIAYAAVFAVIASYVFFSDKVTYRAHSFRPTVPPRVEKMPDHDTLSGLSVLAIDRAKGVRVPLYQAIEIEGVTEYIVSVTKPGEMVFAFPDLGLFNFLADRPCVGRFNIPVIAWTCPGWRKELLLDLKRARPRYVICGRELSAAAFSIQRKTELLPEVTDYIASHYEKEASFGSIDILRRIDER